MYSPYTHCIHIYLYTTSAKTLIHRIQTFVRSLSHTYTHTCSLYTSTLTQAHPFSHTHVKHTHSCTHEHTTRPHSRHTNARTHTHTRTHTNTHVHTHTRRHTVPVRRTQASLRTIGEDINKESRLLALSQDPAGFGDQGPLMELSPWKLGLDNADGQCGQLAVAVAGA